MKNKFVLFGLFTISLVGYSQELQPGGYLSPVFSQAMENEDPKAELERLQSKKQALNIRLQELKNNPAADPQEIIRIEGLLKYIDTKSERLQNYLQSVEYAEKNNAPVKGSMSDEEYKSKKLAWQETLDSNADAQIKTTLTREEFERLPKERQERILSMPERYIILN